MPREERGRRRPAKAVTLLPQAVLERHPDNPTALTYLGVDAVPQHSSSGDLPSESQAAGDRRRASGSSTARSRRPPTFADAYAFRAVLAYRDGRYDDAEADLDALDGLEPAGQRRGASSRACARDIDRAQRTTTTTTSSTTRATG